MVCGGCIGPEDWPMGYYGVHVLPSKSSSPSSGTTSTFGCGQGCSGCVGIQRKEEEEVPKPEQSGSGGDPAQVLGEAQQEVPMSDDTTPAPMTGVSSLPVNPGQFYEDNTLLSDLLPGSGGASSSQAVGGSSTPTKRQEEFGDSERSEVPRVDEPAVPEPKVKASRTEVRMVHDIEAGISDGMNNGTSHHRMRTTSTMRPNYNVEKVKDHRNFR